MEMQALIRQRGTEKGRLTTFCKWVEEWTPAIGSRALQLRIDKINECYAKFNDIQSQILAIDEDESQKAESLAFESNYFDILEKAYNKLENSPVQSPVERQFNRISSPILPKIQLSTFSGDYQEWTSFSDLFTALIINNDSLTNVQRLYYLKSVLKGSAASIVESLALTNANFQIAWNSLQQRFSNKQLIVNTLVKKLSEQPKLHKESGSSLRKLVDDTQRILQSLETLMEPVEQWNTLLIHNVAQKLDPVTRKAWELNHTYDRLPTFKELIQFLSHRCLALETMELECSDVQKTSDKTYKSSYKSQSSNPKKYSFVAYTRTCLYCKGQHQLFNCVKFKAMSVDQRTQQVKTLKACFNCLKLNHTAKQCNGSACRLCGRKHNTLLHRESSANNTTLGTSNSNNNNTTAVCNMASDDQNVLLSTAIVQVQTSSNQWQNCRCLLDNGSQTNIMTVQLCEKLKLTMYPVQVPVNSVNNVINTAFHKVKVNIQSRTDTSYKKTIECLVLPAITGQIPAMQLNTKLVKIPTDIQLADHTFHTPGTIDMLLGAEVFWEIFKTGYKNLGPSKLVLRSSMLGWLAVGKLPVMEQSDATVACLLNQAHSLEQQLKKFWIIEELVESKTQDEQDLECEDIFKNTVARSDSGRYTVTLPRNTKAKELGESKAIALKRMYTLEGKLSKNSQLCEQYTEFMTQYGKLGHMTEIQDNSYENEEHYFIPHFAVVREQSESTPVRVVFNASQKTGSGVSLNDTMLTGPDIHNDLISIMLRFRTYPYALVGDISKFYRQIEVAEKQRNLQLIHWRENKFQPMKIYKLNTITYGITSSPYLAIRTLNQLFKDEGNKYPLATEQQNNWFIDDFVGGSNDAQSVINLQQQIQELLKLGKFPVKKWISNSNQILENIPNQDKASAVIHGLNDSSVVQVLGMDWHPKNDELSYVIKDNENVYTKRSVLSEIASSLYMIH